MTIIYCMMEKVESIYVVVPESMDKFAELKAKVSLIPKLSLFVLVIYELYYCTRGRGCG